MPKGRPQASCLRQMEAYLKDMGVCLGDVQTEGYLKDMGMTDLASAWAMVRRRPEEYRHKVDSATVANLLYLYSTNIFTLAVYVSLLYGKIFVVMKTTKWLRVNPNVFGVLQLHVQ